MRREALKMISEIRTMRWVRDQNFERGTAPASDAVASKYNEKTKAVGEGLATNALMQSTNSGTKRPAHLEEMGTELSQTVGCL